MAIDEGFLARTYRTSAYVWAFVALTLLSLQQWYVAVGWTLGSAVSIGTLRSLEVVIRKHFVPGAAGSRGALAKASVVKLVALIGVLSLVILLGGRSFAFVLAFAAGVVLTQAVMFLKVLGMLITRRGMD